MSPCTPLIGLPEEVEQYIPVDKSWENRRIVLGLVHRTLGLDELEKLQKQPQLSNDIIALYRCATSWILNQTDLHVGESGTLYRILRYLTWKFHMQVQFIKEGSLQERNICDNSLIIHLAQRELLKLDNGTTQWASAAALSGDHERIKEPPFKLQVTYDAIQANREGKIHQQRDDTIKRQALSFLNWRETGEMKFLGKQSEDYCFMRAFGIMGVDEGKRIWPKLALQESDRLDGFEEQIHLAETGRQITVNDHRPVAALAMKYHLGRERFLHPDSVNKSWSQFWDFMNHIT